MRNRVITGFLLAASTATAVIGQQPPTPRGDAARGKALYDANQCADCHRLGQNGSRVGPDLSTVGDSRSPEQLYRAIVAPDEEVLPENRNVRVMLKDGTAVVGRILNQDAFSIQMLTSAERLESYERSDLREHTIIQNGLMPSYEGKLGSQDVADIVRYVASWQPSESPPKEDESAERSESARRDGGGASGAPPSDVVGAVRRGQSPPGLEKSTTYERIVNAEREPQNWLTYGGNYSSHRFSTLDKITRDNVGSLTLKWTWRPRYLDKMETTPIVVDGVMYVVQNSEVVAMDAATGRAFWTYRYRVPPESNAYLMVVKGLAFWEDRVFWATYDGHLIAIDAKTGKEIWHKTVFNYKDGLQFNVAPLVVKDMLILGPATNEFGVNCWVAAFDVRSGKEIWRFKTVPEPGEPGNETWPGDSWQHGGAPIWVTGSYDPETNLTFWGTGNPNPGWNGGARNPGDNLYGDSVVALDADTGKLKWHYQFTPNDEFDWDSVQVPVLATIDWQGKPRKVMLWANRNGFFYGLDRKSGEFLFAKAFVKQNWNIGFDNGRPVKAPAAKPTPEGTVIFPGTQGGTNWYSPSFSPRTGLFYVSVWDNYSAVSTYAEVPPWKPYTKYTGRAPRGAGSGRGAGAPGGGRASAANRTEAEGYGAVRALDPKTGDRKWEFKMVDYTEAGVLTTGSDLLFSGGREGHFFALDARTGALLWRANLGGTIAGGPMTFAVNGKQYVAVAGDNTLYVFGLQ
jgi:alcohol dehydrogenase (cytochrome c)